MKPCKHCSRVLPLDAFYKHKRMADGHINVCKACRDIYVKAWQAENIERRREIANTWRKRNYDTEKVAVVYSRWYQKTKTNGKYCNMVARGARRRAVESRATPPWANPFFIAEAYDLAHRRTRLTGIEWHVDHVVPLQSNTVCGLHAENNLACIPAFENLSKHNRHWPDMPMIDN
ncbi:MAG: hypothetical protein AB7E55_16000 [Pigmentiphaga sp.]